MCYKATRSLEPGFSVYVTCYYPAPPSPLPPATDTSPLLRCTCTSGEKQLKRDRHQQRVPTRLDPTANNSASSTARCSAWLCSADSRCFLQIPETKNGMSAVSWPEAHPGSAPTWHCCSRAPFMRDLLIACLETAAFKIPQDLTKKPQILPSKPPTTFPCYFKFLCLTCPKFYTSLNSKSMAGKGLTVTSSIIVS